MPCVPELLKRKAGTVESSHFPAFVTAITNMVEDDTTSAQEIAEVIQRDQVLSAKILKVNSPVYGFPRRIRR